MSLILPSMIFFQRHSVVIASLGRWQEENHVFEITYTRTAVKIEMNAKQIWRPFAEKFLILTWNTRTHTCLENHTTNGSNAEYEYAFRFTDQHTHSATQTKTIVKFLFCFWFGALVLTHHFYKKKLNTDLCHFGFVWQMRKLFRFVASDKEKWAKSIEMTAVDERSIYAKLEAMKDIR